MNQKNKRNNNSLRNLVNFKNVIINKINQILLNLKIEKNNNVFKDIKEDSLYERKLY